MAARIPLIVGFGGVNPTGRLSFQHGYRRTVIDALDETRRLKTYRSLATLMGISGDPASEALQRAVLEGTLIRQMDTEAQRTMRWQYPVSPTSGGTTFQLAKRHLPDPLPSGWAVTDDSADPVQITFDQGRELYAVAERQLKVSAAGQLPRGFDPGNHYASRSHPRGLQLAVFGASDALRSSGLALEYLKEKVAPDDFAVFSASAMGQLDAEGYASLYRNPLTGKRPTSKNAALGIADMPGDFINAYVLGTAGHTSAVVGACATFLYNLKRGADAIANGEARVAMVGSAEASIIPEVIEGYRTMGALTEDEALALLDNAAEPDLRRACRPFAENCGFTVAESGAYALLMDAELALEVGARNLGAVAGVFINADGFKKSIPGPGIGNYLTVGKALGLARSILGEQALKVGTHMQAHGTGTPQNRTTESAIFSELAGHFGLTDWRVAANKAFTGHSLGPAGGDQLAAALGTFADAWLPGIPTITELADDVSKANLRFSLQAEELAPEQRQAAFINSKGFGGNNATGLILSPATTENLLEQRFGKETLHRWHDARERAEADAASYDERMLEKTQDAIYHFGEGVLNAEDLELSATGARLPGYALPATFEIDTPFED